MVQLLEHHVCDLEHVTVGVEAAMRGKEHISLRLALVPYGNQLGHLLGVGMSVPQYECTPVSIRNP